LSSNIGQAGTQGGLFVNTTGTTINIGKNYYIKKVCAPGMKNGILSTQSIN
jgi:hypothetical protein